jgi:hypothetical protein
MTMKMSVKRMWGAVQVRGGRILVVSHDHQVSTNGYDARGDDPKIHVAETEERIRQETGSLPFMPRTFDAKWINAKVGDLAVEVISVKNGRVLGYAYLSGGSINVFRYVNDTDRDLVAGWFSTGKGLRFEVSLTDPEQFICSMMALKYSGAHVAVTSLIVHNDEEREFATRVLLEAYRYADETRGATTDVLVKVSLSKGKEFAFMHMQAEKRGQEYACQPFVFEVLESSPDLAHHDFLVPMERATQESPL